MSNNIQNNQKIIKADDIIFNNLKNFLKKDLDKYLNIVLSILHRFIKDYNKSDITKYLENIKFDNYDNTFNINFKDIEKQIEDLVLEEEKVGQLYDIMELLNLCLFSNIFDLSQEFSINLYCFDNGQKINKQPILEDLKKRLSNKKFVNDELYNYIFDDKKCMDDFENFLKNIIKGKIKLINKIFLYLKNQIVNENKAVLIYLKNKINNENKPFLIYLKNNQKIFTINKIFSQFDIDFNYMLENFSKEKNIDILYKLSFIYYRYKTDEFFNNKDYIHYFGKIDFVQANIGSQNVWNFFPGIKIFENIIKLDLSHNFFGPLGFYELSKILYYNRNIKIINLSFNEIDMYCLKYLVLGMEFFNNIKEYELEELDLFNNNIEEDCIIYINYLMNSFKKLKIINLNHNRLRNGLKSFFLNLKNLYKRNKNYNLEQLFLSDNQADIDSILELANCIKLKYFKLKILVINNWNLNNFAGIKFLKNLKYNRQLEELYIYKSGINNSFIKSISNIIKYTNINILSLYKSNLSIMEMIIKIYSKIQLINVLDIEKNKFLIPILFNLDLSNPDIFNLTIEDLNVIKNIIDHSNNIIIDYYDIFKEIENEYVKERKKNEYEKNIEKFNLQKESLEKKNKKNSNEYKDVINKLDNLKLEYKGFNKNSKYDENNLENLYNKIKEINELMSNKI